MAEPLPPALQPPAAVSLAKLIKAFPGPNALPGGLWAEPKWDGYRTTAFIGPNQVTLWSRQGKELTRISVGVRHGCADLCAGEKAVTGVRQVSYARCTRRNWQPRSRQWGVTDEQD